MPSITPTISTDAPSVMVRNSGSSECTSSLEVSISKLTKPSTHTPRGMRVIAPAAVAVASPSRSERKRVGQVAHHRPHAGQRLEVESVRDQLEDRRRVVERVIDIAALGERRHDDGRDCLLYT